MTSISEQDDFANILNEHNDQLNALIDQIIHKHFSNIDEDTYQRVKSCMVDYAKIHEPPMAPESDPELVHQCQFIGKTLSGKEFKENFPRQMSRYFSKDMIHRGIKCQLGLNMIEEFNIDKEGKPRGFYFLSVENSCQYPIDENTPIMAYVTVPDDARVYIDTVNSFETDKLIITNLYEFQGVPSRYTLICLEKDKYYILSHSGNNLTELVIVVNGDTYEVRKYLDTDVRTFT